MAGCPDQSDLYELPVFVNRLGGKGLPASRLNETISEELPTHNPANDPSSRLLLRPAGASMLTARTA